MDINSTLRLRKVVQARVLKCEADPDEERVDLDGLVQPELDPKKQSVFD